MSSLKNPRVYSGSIKQQEQYPDCETWMDYSATCEDCGAMKVTVNALCLCWECAAAKRKAVVHFAYPEGQSVGLCYESEVNPPDLPQTVTTEIAKVTCTNCMIDFAVAEGLDPKEVFS